ncbi:MAG: helix-turn-helix transcriptional regulator [Acidobacteria bacterium]|nr:helix-turn-helix transcriptional regulator [Acidobacteriota bacterium]
MSKMNVAVSRATRDALGVLGNQIKLGRYARGWTIVEMAARLGVNPRTASALEGGAPTVSIGTVFNAAVLVGVDLFGLTGPDLARARRAGEETLALLPEKVRKPVVKESANDFAF